MITLIELCRYNMQERQFVSAFIITTQTDNQHLEAILISSLLCKLFLLLNLIANKGKMMHCVFLCDFFESLISATACVFKIISD